MGNLMLNFSLKLFKVRKDDRKIYIFNFFISMTAVSCQNLTCYRCTEEKGGVNTCGDYDKTMTEKCIDGSCAKLTYKSEVLGKTVRVQEHSCSRMMPILGVGNDICAGKKNTCFKHDKVVWEGMTFKDMRICCCDQDRCNSATISMVSIMCLIVSLLSVFS